MPLVIRTNNVARLILTWDELTADEQKDFDYIVEENRDCASFVRYKGHAYDLGDVMRCPTSEESAPDMRAAGFHKWHGYAGDSFFSGVVVRYCEDNAYVVMGRYCC